MTALERVRRAEKLPGDYQEDRIHKMACVGRPWSKFDGRSGGGAGTFFKGIARRAEVPDLARGGPSLAEEGSFLLRKLKDADG